MIEVPDIEVDKDLLLDMYRRMLLIRRFEEQAAKAYQQKKILGFCHLYIGQEAMAVGAISALQPDDPVVTAYREHGQALARGMDADAVMAELFGKATGVTKGIGGSMHLVSAEHHFWGGYGIVGGQVPLGIGAAFASKYKGDSRVSLTFLGEGAASQGAFFEALALAQVWNLPAVVLVENNLYGMGTAVDRASYITDMSERAKGVGMAHHSFDGHDVVDVYRVLSAAAEHARSGKGPVLLQGSTYRYRGHSMSDPAKYRPEGELEEHQKKRDGILLVEARLRDEHGLTEEELDAEQKAAKARAKASYEAADAAPEPDPAHLYDYTFAE